MGGGSSNGSGSGPCGLQPTALRLPRGAVPATTARRGGGGGRRGEGEVVQLDILVEASRVFTGTGTGTGFSAINPSNAHTHAHALAHNTNTGRQAPLTGSVAAKATRVRAPAHRGGPLPPSPPARAWAARILGARWAAGTPRACSPPRSRWTVGAAAPVLCLACRPPRRATWHACLQTATPWPQDEPQATVAKKELTPPRPCPPPPPPLTPPLRNRPARAGEPLRDWHVFPLQLDDASSISFAHGLAGERFLSAARRLLAARGSGRADAALVAPRDTDHGAEHGGPTFYR